MISENLQPTFFTYIVKDESLLIAAFTDSEAYEIAIKAYINAKINSTILEYCKDSFYKNKYISPVKEYAKQISGYQTLTIAEDGCLEPTAPFQAVDTRQSVIKEILGNI